MIHFGRAPALATATAIDPFDEAARHNARVMELFDAAVVPETLNHLRAELETIRTTGNTGFFDHAFTSRPKLLARDPTHPEIRELDADLFAASPKPAHWPEAIEGYRRAQVLGGDKKRLDEKISKIESRNGG